MKHNNSNFARELFRLRRAFYRDRYLEKLAAEPTIKVDANLVQQIEQATMQIAAENEQLKEALKRQKADFDNYRRRTQKEKEQLRDAAKESLVAELLPVLDNFERAIASAKTATDVESVRKGIEMVAEQLNAILRGEGLERIDALGSQFDPALHEALEVEERTDVPEGQITQVLRPGYRFKDRVIRPALVKVAKKPASAEAGEKK
jgi:molecular chaperone GrpE